MSFCITLIASFLRNYVGRTSSWSSQDSSCFSSSLHSSECRRLGAKPSTRSQRTSTCTRQEECWTWTWTSPAQSWTTWGRTTSTEESLPEKIWNWAQFGMTCVWLQTCVFWLVYWGQLLYSYILWLVQGVFCWHHYNMGLQLEIQSQQKAKNLRINSWQLSFQGLSCP